MIAARIDALSPGAKATLADAAVVGGAFWRGALEALGAGGRAPWTKACSSSRAGSWCAPSAGR